MLKELVEYLEQRPEPKFTTHGGVKYSDKKLFEIANPMPDVVKTTTLQSVVDYITNRVDAHAKYPISETKTVIHVISPTEVSVLTEINEDGTRYERIRATALTPRIHYDDFADCEVFNIMLQTSFVDNDGRKAVLGVIGNVCAESNTTIQDDGVTQSVTLRQGVQRVGKSKVPNPVTLAPYRTFPEVEQPESPFVFRLKNLGEGIPPVAALFEADGTAWRLEAMSSIKAYLEEHLGSLKDNNREVIILA